MLGWWKTQYLSLWGRRGVCVCEQERKRGGGGMEGGDSLWNRKADILINTRYIDLSVEENLYDFTVQVMEIAVPSWWGIRLHWLRVFLPGIVQSMNKHKASRQWPGQGGSFRKVSEQWCFSHSTLRGGLHQQREATGTSGNTDWASGWQGSH